MWGDYIITLKFPIYISIRACKAVFRINTVGGSSIVCLYDTGADIPVWCKGEELFLEWVKDYKDVRKFKSSALSGFGKIKENTIIYEIPNFVFTDGKNEIRI